MIAASTSFYLSEGSEKSFLSSKMLAQGTYYPVSELFSVQLLVLRSSLDDEEYRMQMTITKAEVEAETGAGGTLDVEKLYMALQEAVITKLEAITENSGVTFTATL